MRKWRRARTPAHPDAGLAVVARCAGMDVEKMGEEAFPQTEINGCYFFGGGVPSAVFTAFARSAALPFPQ